MGVGAGGVLSPGGSNQECNGCNRERVRETSVETGSAQHSLQPMTVLFHSNLPFPGPHRQSSVMSEATVVTAIILARRSMT